MGKQHRIYVAPEDAEVVAEEGQTVLSSLLEGGIEWMHVCGQLCNCTTCAIVVQDGMDNLSPMEDDERQTLKRFRGPSVLDEPVRLSCQAEVHGPVTITEPDWY